METFSTNCCIHCESTNIHYDIEVGRFICNTCGMHETNTGVKQLPIAARTTKLRVLLSIVVLLFCLPAISQDSIYYIHDTIYVHDTFTKVVFDTTVKFTPKDKVLLQNFFPNWFTPNTTRLDIDTFRIVGSDTIFFRWGYYRNNLYNNTISTEGNDFLQMPNFDNPLNTDTTITDTIGFYPSDTGKGVSFIPDNYIINQRYLNFLNAALKYADSTNYQYDKESGLFKRKSGNGGKLRLNTNSHKGLDLEYILKGPND